MKGKVDETTPCAFASGKEPHGVVLAQKERGKPTFCSWKKKCG
jgi:hypothetical protein